MDWDRFERLLDELLDLPEPARAARLAALASADPASAARLREALDPGVGGPDLERFGALIEAVAADGDGAAEAEPAPPPAAFGPWRPLQRIASGGMGEVWLVRRADGEYDATAALKRLRAGFASAGARERLLRERQLLADLHHPHVATLLDGGVDAEGVPYFVMEYVDGRSLTRHCDEERLGTDARLELFEQVTGAVAAAHQRLIVHRDLKPENILVATDGAVKLVDFGIAKLLDEPPDAGATAAWERVLTPRYAAPEQLAGGTVTTATDVYGLGGVLFELLSGCRPRDEAERRGTAAAELAAVEPPRMSVAFARLDVASAGRLAASRGTTRRQLLRELRGDLDGIVAKALRPDPGDRYPTVASLAADLRRARRREPVEAHRGSWLYRGRKLWVRHWLPATALVAVVAALAAGLSIALAQSRAARLAERRAAAINRFLTDELMGSADPRVARGRDLTVREVVDHAARGAAAAFAGEPAVEAALRRTLGTVSARLGETLPARAQLEAARALAERSGGDRLERARLARAFAELAFAEGRFARARDEIGAAVDGLAAALGEGSTEALEARVLAGRILVADGDVIDAERRLRELVARADGIREEAPALAASARVELAAALKAQGRREEALGELLAAARVQEATFGADHPDLAQTLEQQAHILAWVGRHAEAEAAARRALEIDHRVFGPAHWRSLRGASFLAEALARAGRTEAAMAAAEAALAVASPELGADHPEVAALRNTLAILATRAGDPAAALAHYRAALAGAERGPGPSDELTQMIRRNFANFLARRGDRAESLRLARQVRELGLAASRAPAPDPMALANAAWFLATAELAEARDLDAAVALAEQAVAASRGRWYYPWVALSEARFRRGELDAAIAAELRAVALPDALHLPGEDRYLVRLLTEKGDLEGAADFLREQLARRLRARAPDDPLLGQTRALLGRVLLAAGHLEEAEGELQAALELFDLRLDADHEWRIPALADLGAVLAVTGSGARAAETLREAERLAARATGPLAEEERARIDARLAALAGAGTGADPAPAPTTARPDGDGARPSP